MNCVPLDISTALSGPRPLLDFVLPNLLAGTVGTLVATGGIGKTMLLTELSVSLAAGLSPAGGLFPEQPPARVVFLAAEESADILVHRLMDVSHVHCRPGALGARSTATYRAQLVQNLSVFPLAGETVLLLKGGTYTPALDQLMKLAEGCRLLIVDPLRRFHDADENDSSAMTQLVQGFERVAHRLGCAVILAHHVSKSAYLVGRGDVQHSSRGSTALTDGVRWQANLTPMDAAQGKICGISPAKLSNYVRFAVTKANHDAVFPPVWLMRADGGVLLRADINPSTEARAFRRERRELPRV
jgi:regulatory protein RepA